MKKYLESVKGKNIYFYLQMSIMGNAFAIGTFYNFFQSLMLYEANISCKPKLLSDYSEYVPCTWKEACAHDIQFIFNKADTWTSEFGFYCDKPMINLGLNLGSYFFLGRMLGCLGSSLADYMGRKRIIIIFQIIQILLLIWLACSTKYESLILPIIGIGFINSNISSACLLFANENVPTSERELMSCILLTSQESLPIFFALLTI